MDCHLRSVAIMIEVTSRHTECTNFNFDYSWMPAVALRCDERDEATSSLRTPDVTKLHLPRCNWT